MRNIVGRDDNTWRPNVRQDEFSIELHAENSREIPQKSEWKLIQFVCTEWEAM